MTEIHQRPKVQDTQVDTIEARQRNFELARSGTVSRSNSALPDLGTTVESNSHGHNNNNHNNNNPSIDISRNGSLQGYSNLQYVKAIREHQHCQYLKSFISKFRNQIQRSPITNEIIDLDVKDISNNLYSDQFLFFLISMLTVAVESYRICGVLRVSNSFMYVCTTIIVNIITETISRNNLYYEAFYRLILKKPNPPLSKCYSIYYGVKFKIEYLPLFLVILYNLLQFGPSYWCYQNVIPSNIDFMEGKLGWWFVIIYLFGEIMTDLSSEGLFQILVNRRIIHRNSNAHTVRFVKTYYLETGVMYAMFSIVIWNAFLYDCSVRCVYK